MSLLQMLLAASQESEAPLPIVATGGLITEYEDGGTRYKAHIFTSSSDFVVSSVTTPVSVDFLVVAGGGGGGSGSNTGGGGGAGGFRTSMPDAPGGPGTSAESKITITGPLTYPISVGAGGFGGDTNNGNTATQGTPSFIGPSPSKTVESIGGGKGGDGNANPGGPGGSGGGGAGDLITTTGGPAVSPTQGYAGGGCSNSNAPSYAGGGGGGAGGAGQPGVPGSRSSSNGAGGFGKRTTITGPGYLIGTPGPGGTGGYLAGGGATGSENPVAFGGGGYGGGGNGDNPGPAQNGTTSTGGGGGGQGTTPVDDGGSGGSGIIVLRYAIPPSAKTAKATGGIISFANGKTYHTFRSTDTFTVTNGPITAETLIVAGGGGGGYYGGGGGAGGLLWYGSPTPTKTANGAAITYNNSTSYPISIGGGGASVGPYSVDPKRGNSGTATVLTHPSGPYSATSGGGGGGNAPGDPTPHSGLPGGSGGGASNQNASGSPGPGVPGQGFAGGSASGTTNTNEGGGGGGAGGAGTNGGSGSHGGIGLQFPVFSDIGAGVAGPGGGGGWFAGGGGGIVNGLQPTEGKGGGPGGPYAGGGNAVPPGNTTQTQDGTAGTGGGGGSSYAPPSVQNTPGNGGSGIVIIVYPS